METESRSKFITELPIETREVLKNIDFPLTRKEIIEQARKNGAIQDILRELGMLPEKKYNSAEEVARELHRIYIGVPSLKA